MINLPKIAIIEVEILVNKKLFENGTITEEQYIEANKILYEKITKYKEESIVC